MVGGDNTSKSRNQRKGSDVLLMICNWVFNSPKLYIVSVAGNNEDTTDKKPKEEEEEGSASTSEDSGVESEGSTDDENLKDHIEL